MRRRTVLPLCLLVPFFVLAGCGFMPGPDVEDTNLIMQQLERSDEAAEIGCADLGDEVEDALARGVTRAVDIYASMGVSQTTVNDLRNVPSDEGYAEAWSGTVHWGGHLIAWSTYRWADGRWEKKAEWQVLGSVAWGRYIKTAAPAVEGDVETRSFTRGLWVNGKLSRYATGTHVLNAASSSATVNGTGYLVRWLGAAANALVRVVHAHTLSGGENQITITASNQVFRNISGTAFTELGTWTGTSEIHPQAVGTDTLLYAVGSLTPIDQTAFTNRATTYLVLADKTQTYTRKTTLADTNYRLIALNAAADGSGSGTAKLYNASDVWQSDLATATWNDMGDGTLTILNGPGSEDDASVTIHINIPRYLR